MRREWLTRLLKDLKSEKISLKKCIEALKELPYVDLGFAKIDSHREIRRGFPEVIFAEGKTLRQIEKIARAISAKKGIIFVTRANRGVFIHLKKSFPKIHYNETARIIYNKKAGNLNRRKRNNVVIVTGGTADLPVAEEARVTLEVMGCRVKVLCDVGVAGLHRVLEKVGVLNRASVIIVIAGMEGALASVVSGLTAKPVIAVPTSVGYGASFKGIAPLLTMLNACSPGIGVVNIDNGFGAAYLARLIVS